MKGGQGGSSRRGHGAECCSANGGVTGCSAALNAHQDLGGPCACKDRALGITSHPLYSEYRSVWSQREFAVLIRAPLEDFVSPDL